MIRNYKEQSGYTPEVDHALVTRTEVLHLDDSIKRIPKGATSRPRNGLPDFSDRETYELLLDLAGGFYGDDEDFQGIPAYDAFMATSLGRHFVGEIPRSEVPQEEMSLLGLLARYPLQISGDQVGITLAIMHGVGEKRLGFGTFRVFEPLSKTPIVSRTTQQHALARILIKSNDPYWKALKENDGIRDYFSIGNPTALCSSNLRRTGIVEPVRILVVEDQKRKGLGSALTRAIVGKRALVSTTAKAEVLLMTRRALPHHMVVLAPYLTMLTSVQHESEMDHFLTAMALQRVVAETYRQQHQDLVEAGSPAAELLSQLAGNPPQWIDGIWRIGNNGDDNNVAIITENGRRFSGSEKELLLSNRVSGDEADSILPIVALPSHLIGRAW